jgi:hypothetical protein
MKWIFAGTLCLAWVGGCISGKAVPPEKNLPTSNSGYSVDQLFTDANGCKVYRFYDQGEFRYYVLGPNGAQMLPTTKTVTDTDVETIDVDSGGGHGHGGGGGHKH